MSKIICSRCRRPVFQPEEKSAFGKVWHSFCFSCYACNKLLDCTNVQSTKDELYCIDCMYMDNEEDQCPSERCIRSSCSKSKSLDNIRCNTGNAQNIWKNTNVIYPCTIPVPYAISAWYNRQHPKKPPPSKQAFCTPSCESCASSTKGSRLKGCAESVCPCSSPPPLNEPNSEVSIRSKRLVSFECEKKDQTTVPEKCYQKETVLDTQRSCGKSDKICFSKKKKSSMCKNVDGGSLKSIDSIKKALLAKDSQQSSLCAASENDPCYKSCPLSLRCSRSGKNLSLGGGMDCRRCGRKVYYAEMFTVPGAAYHDTCFCCLDCRKPLDLTTVCASQGDIFCKLCYIRNFGPVGYGYGLGAGALQSPSP